MQMTVQTSAARPGRPLYRARRKTVDVRARLEVASAELGLTNLVLEKQLESVKRSSGSTDVKRALSQNEAIEEKVQEAADELKVVTDLLDEEVAERERLERELASRPPA